MAIMDCKLGRYKLKIFPEAYTTHPSFLMRKGFISIGGLDNKNLEVVMVNDKGKILDRRGRLFYQNRMRDMGMNLVRNLEFSNWGDIEYYLSSVTRFVFLAYGRKYQNLSTS